ncbi:hypothetical protein JQN72_09920 [Phycicoccus sp. CSK15P-2]|uniref:hypothetical protein n=1 Tax=Phycicoccus sp. CSK15P-2 TaxID=2807627 RepID=UPI0019528EEA|nr:hypothetical protein [Phycicoccus sp. CSK15P-2]MBM6404556.1 hypothetical protein [Phycicoccus sp. CSK15P-2]
MPITASRRTPATGPRPVAGVVAVVITILLAGGCASPREQAREDATSAVRDSAEALRSRIAAAAAGTAGADQLEAVRAVLPDQPLEAASEGPGVVVTGSLTARSEAGGGLSYEQFVARLCLRYTVREGSGETSVADAPCPAGGDVPPADGVVTLDGDP